MFGVSGFGGGGGLEIENNKKTNLLIYNCKHEKAQYYQNSTFVVISVLLLGELGTTFLGGILS